MSSVDDHQITSLLQLAQTDRRAALDAVVPLVYDTLRRLARQQLARERSDHTLNATALAHEAYAKLVGLTRIEWRDRAHFYAAAAGAMRRVLIDYAVSRKAQKRGGATVRVDIDAIVLVADEHLDELMAINDALTRLEEAHAAAARVVECRVFVGMTIDETAEALGVGPATVKRYWVFARAWLARDLGFDLGRTAAQTPEHEAGS